MKQLTLMLIVICGFMLVGCKLNKKSPRTGPQKSDVDFAKEAFRLMAEGDAAAADVIDWEHLSVAGVDAGTTYRAMSNETSRENFRQSFLRSYSSSFKASGGSVDAAINWREESKDSAKTVVLADGTSGKKLLITVVHVDGDQKVSAIDLK